ncbi:MAG: OmpA family protein [Phenylobacterium sp.]|uniref:OmpA family protein n=1 Tax=Phenylobacterium sp. TaxID=1871053 RepID=UPI002733DB2E|nr:OmpA family protein [Phenylobacterium sp.]MDP3174645.1 OmpA family protein [Phenylobacterium sp.]
MSQVHWTGAATLALAIGLAGCATKEVRLVKQTPRCVDQTLEIYFEPDSAEVTPEGKAIVSQAATVAAGCAVDKVEVLGLADSVGAPEANLDLSKRRAQSVTAALADAGLPAAEFALAAAGQDGAVTASGDAQPLRRRVNVVLRLRALP